MESAGGAVKHWLVMDTGRDRAPTPFTTRIAGAGRHLPATLLFDYPSVDALTNYLCKTALGMADQPVSTAPPPKAVAGGSDVLDQIENLDDSEIERRLRQGGAEKHE